MYRAIFYHHSEMSVMKPLYILVVSRKGHVIACYDAGVGYFLRKGGIVWYNKHIHTMSTMHYNHIKVAKGQYDINIKAENVHIGLID